jgi:hypothetical protein
VFPAASAAPLKRFSSSPRISFCAVAILPCATHPAISFFCVSVKVMPGLRETAEPVERILQRLPERDRRLRRVLSGTRRVVDDDGGRTVEDVVALADFVVQVREAEQQVLGRLDGLVVDPGLLQDRVRERLDVLLRDVQRRRPSSSAPARSAPRPSRAPPTPRPGVSDDREAAERRTEQQDRGPLAAVLNAPPTFVPNDPRGPRDVLERAVERRGVADDLDFEGVRHRLVFGRSRTSRRIGGGRWRASPKA